MYDSLYQPRTTPSVTILPSPYCQLYFRRPCTIPAKHAGKYIDQVLPYGSTSAWNIPLGRLAYSKLQHLIFIILRNVTLTMILLSWRSYISGEINCACGNIFIWANLGIYLRRNVLNPPTVKAYIFANTHFREFAKMNHFRGFIFRESEINFREFYLLTATYMCSWSLTISPAQVVNCSCQLGRSKANGPRTRESDRTNWESDRTPYESDRIPYESDRTNTSPIGLIWSPIGLYTSPTGFRTQNQSPIGLQQQNMSPTENLSSSDSN